MITNKVLSHLLFALQQALAERTVYREDVTMNRYGDVPRDGALWWWIGSIAASVSVVVALLTHMPDEESGPSPQSAVAALTRAAAAPAAALLTRREDTAVAPDQQRTAALAPTAAAPASTAPAQGLADAVRVATAESHDGVAGFRVFPGRNRGRFAQLGLHPGDLLTAVNGAPVAGQSGDHVLSRLQSGEAVSVTVLRAGREQRIETLSAR